MSPTTSAATSPAMSPFHVIYYIVSTLLNVQYVSLQNMTIVVNTNCECIYNIVSKFFHM
jgi:hypothetical protein